MGLKSNIDLVGKKEEEKKRDGTLGKNNRDQNRLAGEQHIRHL